MGQPGSGAPWLPVIAGRTQLRVSGGPDAAACCSTKAGSSASTVCTALGALARPQANEIGLRVASPAVTLAMSVLACIATAKKP